MTLETVFKRFLLPYSAQFADENPRPSGTKGKPHYPGREIDGFLSPRYPDGKNDNPRQDDKYDKRRYRKLNSIRLGDVKTAFEFYRSQLISTDHASFIIPNHFYMIDLAPWNEDIPSAIFGRVNVCHPSGGQIQNIREMELLFPRKNGKPDLVNLHSRDILPDGNVQSYCIGVRFLGTPDDIADFKGSKDLFFDAGFTFDFQTGYIDLLDLKESQKDSLPWFHVIGSRWFASIPDTMQEEIRSRLKKLIEWDSLILNYHPDHTPFDVKTLNRELGFQNGYTKIVLIESRSPEQVLQFIKPKFDKIFAQPVK